LLLCLLSWMSIASPVDAGVDLHVFWSVDCPHCISQKPFLAELAERQPKLVIHEYEISRTSEHHRRFIDMALAHGIEPGSVPTVFAAGRAWVGDSPQIRREIEIAVAWAIGAMSAGDQVDGPPPQPSRDATRLPGGLDPARDSIVLTTLLIAFVDGFNPCSLWVLTLLLGLVIHSGSRGRIALVGITFLTTTSLIYGAFIAGVFSVLSFILYLSWVQWLVAAFALTFGLVNVKDYFWWRRGPSFTIAESHKPGIYKGIRGLTDRRLGGLGLMFATIVMASGIALVELPCTAGFPVVWSGIVADRGISGAAFVLLLALYLLVYLSIELVVFMIALMTLRMQRFEEQHGRALKLIGGMVMVALAVVLVVAPDLMNDLSGSVAVFAAALVAAVLVIAVDRLRRSH
jgi:cytochrome c biogenesis protein CcdA